MKTRLYANTFMVIVLFNLLSVPAFAAVTQPFKSANSNTTNTLSPTYLPAYATSAHDAIERTLKEPVFGATIKKKRIKWKSLFDFSPSKTKHQHWPALFNFLEVLFLWLSRCIEIMLWLIVIFLIGFAFYKRHRWLPYLNWIRFKRTVSVPHSFSPTVKSLQQDPLAGDISSTVLHHWHSDEKVAAFSLLYRATLRDLQHIYHVTIPVGATEIEVIEHVQLQQNDLSAYITQLTNTWQNLVYAHRSPDSIQPLLEHYQHLFLRDPV